MNNPPRRIGKYELREELGSGRAGEVWRGYDYQTRGEVAIKLLHLDLQADPQFLTQFLQEGQTIRTLHHPNLVTVQDIGVARSPEAGDNTPYIVMDFIERIQSRNLAATYITRGLVSQRLRHCLPHYPYQ